MTISQRSGMPTMEQGQAPEWAFRRDGPRRRVHGQRHPVDLGTWLVLCIQGGSGGALRMNTTNTTSLYRCSK
jgi:hypothetical protein